MTCPFCAEEIKAEAIKCRYCGSDVRPAVEAPPTTQGYLWYALGQSYLLGATVSLRGKRRLVGIWTGAGEMVHSEKPTDEGWAEVQRRFAELEPFSVANPHPPTCPRCGATPMRLWQSGDATRELAKGLFFAGPLGALLASTPATWVCPSCSQQL